MADSRDVLLKLVRVAMGWETDFSLPEDVDWQEVLALAQEQGVDAIVVDGLDTFMKKRPQKSSVLNSEEFKQVLFEAIGDQQIVEYNYSCHLKVLKKLSEILGKKDIPFMVMKGFACGQYYPNPKHRFCGDIDIYPGNHFDESNEALKESGINVDPYYYRHSASIIKGVMVENHKVLGDLRGPRHQSKVFEIKLKEEANRSLLAGKDIVVDGHVIASAKYPLANFNALFLPWHVSAHFAFERVTLRQLLDWALFLTHDGRYIDVKSFREAKRINTFGYSKMADILTNLALRYLKIPSENIPSEIIEDALEINMELADKVFDYFFDGRFKDRDSRPWKSRLNNISGIWTERWKYREIYNMSVMAFLYYKVKGVIFNVVD